MNKKELTEILFKLTRQNGVSGDEFCVSKTAAEILKKLNDAEAAKIQAKQEEE